MMHSPERIAEKLAHQSAAGGATKGNFLLRKLERKPTTIEELSDGLAGTISALHRGLITEGRAKALSPLYKTGLEAFKVRDLQREVDELRGQVAKLMKPRGHAT